MSLKQQKSFDYVVSNSDTLERIAAMFDCTPTEIMKLNKMGSRMVFAGQRILVPDHSADTSNDENKPPHSAVGSSQSRPETSSSLPESKACDHNEAAFPESAQLPHSLVLADPVDNMDDQPRVHKSPTTPKSRPLSPEEQLDIECLQRFLKLHVKHFTDAEGCVNGVLLVTPNCVMFDPDVTHPLVKENGPEKYGMIAKMENIIAIALYKDITAMTGEDKSREDVVYRSESQEGLKERAKSDSVLCDASGEDPAVRRSLPSSMDSSTLSSSPKQKTVAQPTKLHLIPEISEQEAAELHQLLTAPVNPHKRHLSESDLQECTGDHDDSKDGAASATANSTRGSQYLGLELHQEHNKSLLSCPGSFDRSQDSLDVVKAEVRDRAQSEISPPKETPPQGKPPKLAQKLQKKALGSRFSMPGKKLTSLRHTLQRSVSVSAQAVGGAVSSGASAVGGAIATGAHTAAAAVTSGAHVVGDAVGAVGGAVTSGASAVGGALATGAQSAAAAVTNMPKTITNMPRNIVNMSSGIFSLDDDELGSPPTSFDMRDDWFRDPLRLTSSPKPTLRDEVAMRKQRSVLKLEELKAKAHQARQEATHKESKANLQFHCATSRDERPDLFAPLEEMLPRTEYQPTTELPYFLCFHVDPRKRREERHERSLVFGDKRKSEYWFTVPKDKVDSLYMFFVQWNPEKYGSQDEEDTGGAASVLEKVSHEGFVVIDSEEDDKNLTGEQSPSVPSSWKLSTSLNLNREWEIVTVEEVKRRLSLLDLDVSKFPLPDGCQNSTVLLEEHIRQLILVLPARAEGYPWVLIYSTVEHGFSLTTLYRCMREWAEEMSPTLLVVKDTAQNIFGAIVSCPLRCSDHFYSTGESLLFTFYPEFREFRWSGENQFFVKGNRDSLVFGSDRGKFGLYLDGDLYRGRTQHVATFDNDPLTSAEDFIVAGVEAWGFCI